MKRKTNDTHIRMAFSNGRCFYFDDTWIDKDSDSPNSCERDFRYDLGFMDA